MSRKRNTAKDSPFVQKVADLITHEFEQTGTVPTIRELTEMLGFKSSSSTWFYLKEAATQGLITHNPNRTPAYLPAQRDGCSNGACRTTAYLRQFHPEILAEMAGRADTIPTEAQRRDRWYGGGA